MKIAVTGGGGFLGRFVCRALKKRGHQVFIIGRGKYQFAEKEGFSVLTGDICDQGFLYQALCGIDEVHHIASLTGISVFPEPFYRTNVTGTENVIRACQKNGIEKLIYTSSPSVIFDGNDHVLADESLSYPLRYISHYAHTKAIAESLILKADSTSLKTISLRPHLIFGPEDNSLIPRLLKRAEEGKLMQVGNGNNMADLTYVENAAIAHVCASEAIDHNPEKVCGRAYFITNGEPVNVWDFISRILKECKRPPLKKCISQKSAYAAGFLLEKIYRLTGNHNEPPMTRFLALQLSKNHTYSTKQAENLLGFKPEISMESGISSLIRYQNSR